MKDLFDIMSSFGCSPDELFLRSEKLSGDSLCVQLCVSGGRYPGKTLVLEKLGAKEQGGLGEVLNKYLGPKRRLAPGCLSQRLKIGTRPCCGDRYCCPIYPRGGRYPEKTQTLILEIAGGGGKCVRWRG